MTGASRWAGAASRFVTPWRRRATILLYHRVASPELDPWSLAVTPAHFAEHLQVLRRHASVVPLSQLQSVLAQRHAPRRCVAVTFDDGYADNLHAAAPLLAAHDVPATIFVIAGTLGGTELWWDRLARLLLSPGNLPERLALEIGGAPMEWALGEWATYDSASAQRHRAWRADAEAPTLRHAVYLELWRRLQPLPRAERERYLGEIEAWTGAIPSMTDARTLTVAELGALAVQPIIEIGGHTVTHPRLASLAVDDQRAEIADGKRILEDIVGRSLDTFAFPFGRPDDFTSDTVRAVRESGFRLSCSNYSGGVRASTDPFRLPRAYVHDCDGDTFERRLVGWLDAPSR